jgi:hypothetical protein
MGNLEAEAKWIRLYFISFFSAILDESQEENRPVPSDSPAPRKRIRTSNNFNEILRVATLGPVSRQISSLQTLAFHTTMTMLETTQLANVISNVTPLMSHGNGILASWAILVLSGCARQAASRDKALNPSWVRVWQFTTRAIPSQATSRVASWLGNIIMVLQLVPYSALAENLEHMQSRPDLAGPAVLAESSIAFWLSVIRLINSESPSISHGSSEKILSWVFRKWFPSKSEYLFEYIFVREKNPLVSVAPRSSRAACHTVRGQKLRNLGDPDLNNDTVPGGYVRSGIHDQCCSRLFF